MHEATLHAKAVLGLRLYWDAFFWHGWTEQEIGAREGLGQEGMWSQKGLGRDQRSYAGRVCSASIEDVL